MELWKARTCKISFQTWRSVITIRSILILFWSRLLVWRSIWLVVKTMYSTKAAFRLPCVPVWRFRRCLPLSGWTVWCLSMAGWTITIRWMSHLLWERISLSAWIWQRAICVVMTACILPVTSQRRSSLYMAMTNMSGTVTGPICCFVRIWNLTVLPVLLLQLLIRCYTGEKLMLAVIGTKSWLWSVGSVFRIPIPFLYSRGAWRIVLFCLPIHSMSVISVSMEPIRATWTGCIVSVR